MSQVPFLLVVYSLDLVRRIPKRHAWAITGTPVGRHGLDDLMGLFHFLDIFSTDTHADTANAKKANSKKEDSQNFMDAFEDTWPLLSQSTQLIPFLQYWMHRELKSSAILSLPRQHEYTFWLNWSTVEQHYYESLKETMDALMQDLSLEEEGRRHQLLREWTLTLRKTW
jgi:hypothetical protein